MPVLRRPKPSRRVFKREREKNAFGEVKPGAGEIKKAAEAYGTNTERPVDLPQ
jgi:hypothetical protein